MPTLRRMEASPRAATGLANNVVAVRTALEAAGVEFIPENGGGAGVRLKNRTAAAGDRPEPAGPATDAVKAMDAAIEGDRVKRKPVAPRGRRSKGEENG